MSFTFPCPSPFCFEHIIIYVVKSSKKGYLLLTNSTGFRTTNRFHLLIESLKHSNVLPIILMLRIYHLKLKQFNTAAATEKHKKTFLLHFEVFYMNYNKDFPGEQGLINLQAVRVFIQMVVFFFSKNTVTISIANTAI